MSTLHPLQRQEGFQSFIHNEQARLQCTYKLLRAIAVIQVTDKKCCHFAQHGYIGISSSESYLNTVDQLQRRLYLTHVDFEINFSYCPVLPAFRSLCCTYAESSTQLYGYIGILLHNTISIILYFECNTATYMA